MNAGKTRIAVVFGGRSSEHTISCLSAGSVLANLDRDRFEVVPIGITPEGGWVLGSGDPADLRVDNGELPRVDSGTSVVLAGDPTSDGVVTFEPGTVPEVLSGVDVVFPVLHGAFGEDGTIQGLVELAGLPYVGAGVLASAVAMDKEYAKKLLAAEGLPVGEYAVLRRGQGTLPQAQRDRLGLPVFVKPARAGSSVGISKVSDWAELDSAIEHARRHDPKVLVEQAVTGREIECGVLEFPDGSVRASLPAEIRVTADGDDAAGWYDFDSKYLHPVELDVPAELDDSVQERIRAAAVSSFTALEGQGLARVDFFVTERGTLVVNEVNTMPGLTSISAYAKMFSETGVEYAELLSTLIDTARARGTGLR